MPETNGRILQIYRNGNRLAAATKIQLPTGAQANLITLREMAKIVREDSKYPDLRNYVFREIIGFDKTEKGEQIEAIFTFCRDKIVYKDEASGFETIADLWSAIYAFNPFHGQGDCAIKSVALATCLTYLGLKPYFVAIRQIPNVDYFNHVFVAIKDENGNETALDATPEEFRVGLILPFYERLDFPIF